LFFCFGYNFRTIEIPKEASELSTSFNFEIKTEKFTAAAEQLRAPRNVRVGLFQNKLPLKTTAPIIEQRQALYNLAEKAISAAAALRVNIFCFQETWSKWK
jgi:beta-ureidopropionase